MNFICANFSSNVFRMSVFVWVQNFFYTNSKEALEAIGPLVYSQKLKLQYFKVEVSGKFHSCHRFKYVFLMSAFVWVQNVFN